MDFNGQKRDGGMNIMKSLSNYSDPNNTIRHVRFIIFMPRCILKFLRSKVLKTQPKFPREILQTAEGAMQG